ncbi:MAG: hypothetical protein Q9221_001421 [Calogaya cf. arnoldii]
MIKLIARSALSGGYMHWCHALQREQTAAPQRRSLEGLYGDTYVSRSKEEDWPIAGNNVYTVAKGDNYGGLIAGQVNINDDHASRRERIISWLSPINFRQKQEDVFHDAHPGTGQWFLDSEQFKRWLNAEPSEHMWCHGAPGSGKPVLTSIVINHLRQRFSGIAQVGVAVVYCERKRQDVSTPVNLLASIWRQLVDNKPLADEVLHLYDDTASRALAKFQEVRSILIKETERFRDIYIVIDALDELDVGSECASVLLEAVSTMRPTTSRQVRILATSRFGPSVLSVASVVQITANRQDIKNFVENRFQQGISTSPSLSNRARDERELRETLVDQICKKAGGLFLLARLFIETLKYKTNVHALRNAVQTLPRSINEQYKETWTRVEEQNIDHRNLARRILGWLSHAVGPLKVQELLHALGNNDGRKDSGFRSSRSRGHSLEVSHQNNILAFLRDPMLLESAEQAQRIRLLYLWPAAVSWPETGEAASAAANRLRKNLPLLVAGSFGLEHIAATLLNGPGDFNVDNSLLLHEAVAGRSPCLASILEGSRGRLNMDPLDKNGRTPLHYAVVMGRVDLMELLLKHGPDLTVKDKYQATTLHFSVMSAACTKLTIERGDMLHARDTFHRTALHYAVLVRMRNKKVLKLLTKAGASFATLDSFHKSAQKYIDEDYQDHEAL